MKKHAKNRIKTVSIHESPEALLVPCDTDDQVDEAGVEEICRVIRDVISGLTDRQHQALRLRFFEGKTLKEAGIVMNVAPERVRQLEHKALRRLRGADFIKKLCSYLK